MSNLIKYDAACRALAEAKSIDEVKDIRDKAQAMRAYAQQAKNKQLEIDAAEIRIRAERRLGEMLRDMDKHPPGPDPSSLSRDPPPKLNDLGISYDLSSRAQQIASIPEEEFEQTLAEHREDQQAVSGRTMEKLAKAAHNHRAQGTGENEWYTPDRYIHIAREFLGGIDLDPASSELANKTIRAKAYFDSTADGLDQPWAGKVWMNPPYSQPEIRLFIEKLVAEYSCGAVSEAIALTHNYTDTAWFHLAMIFASAICFTRGRIGFVNPGGVKASPTQGQAFFYFGNRPTQFASAFCDIGTTVFCESV